MTTDTLEDKLAECRALAADLRRDADELDDLADRWEHNVTEGPPYR